MHYDLPTTPDCPRTLEPNMLMFTSDGNAATLFSNVLLRFLNKGQTHYNTPQSCLFLNTLNQTVIIPATNHGQRLAYSVQVSEVNQALSGIGE